MTEQFSFKSPFDLCDFCYIPIKTKKHMTFFAINVFGNVNYIYSLVKYKDIIIIIVNGEKELISAQKRLQDIFGSIPNNYIYHQGDSYELCLIQIDEYYDLIPVYNITHAEKIEEIERQKYLQKLKIDVSLCQEFPENNEEDSQTLISSKLRNYDIREKRIRNQLQYFSETLPYLNWLSLDNWDYLTDFFTCNILKWVVEIKTKEIGCTSDQFAFFSQEAPFELDYYFIKILIIIYIQKIIKIGKDEIFTDLLDVNIIRRKNIRIRFYQNNYTDRNTIIEMNQHTEKMSEFHQVNIPMINYSTRAVAANMYKWEKEWNLASANRYGIFHWFETHIRDDSFGSLLINPKCWPKVNADRLCLFIMALSEIPQDLRSIVYNYIIYN